MLTPQEVSERSFPKANFGGYNMAMVDEFLDQLTEDYTVLYKENAGLKNKMKVLATKVEEYRTTEDAMRKALLAAQQTADQMISEAEAKRDEIETQAQIQVQERIETFRREIDAEEARLTAAQNSTAAYVSRLRELHLHENAFLENLNQLVPTAVGGTATPQIGSPSDASPTIPISNPQDAIIAPSSSDLSPTIPVSKLENIKGESSTTSPPSPTLSSHTGILPNIDISPDSKKSSPSVNATSHSSQPVASSQETANDSSASSHSNDSIGNPTNTSPSVNPVNRSENISDSSIPPINPMNDTSASSKIPSPSTSPVGNVASTPSVSAVGGVTPAPSASPVGAVGGVTPPSSASPVGAVGSVTPPSSVNPVGAVGSITPPSSVSPAGAVGSVTPPPSTSPVDTANNATPSANAVGTASPSPSLSPSGAMGNSGSGIPSPSVNPIGSTGKVPGIPSPVSTIGTVGGTSGIPSPSVNPVGNSSRGVGSPPNPMNSGSGTNPLPPLGSTGTFPSFSGVSSATGSIPTVPSSTGNLGLSFPPSNIPPMTRPSTPPVPPVPPTQAPDLSATQPVLTTPPPTPTPSLSSNQTIPPRAPVHEVPTATTMDEALRMANSGLKPQPVQVPANSDLADTQVMPINERPGGLYHDLAENFGLNNHRRDPGSSTNQDRDYQIK